MIMLFHIPDVFSSIQDPEFWPSVYLGVLDVLSPMSWGPSPGHLLLPQDHPLEAGIGMPPKELQEERKEAAQCLMVNNWQAGMTLTLLLQFFLCWGDLVGKRSNYPRVRSWSPSNVVELSQALLQGLLPIL